MARHGGGRSLVLRFAVGRTGFWDPLVNSPAKKVTRDQAVEQISALPEFVNTSRHNQWAVTA